jgi:GTPase SAR1 family protein
LLYPLFTYLQEAQAVAQSWGVPYLECSSLTGENVNDVFHALLREVSKDDDLLNEKEDNGCNIL